MTRKSVKLLSLLLSALMLTSVLASCSDEPVSKTDDETTPAVTSAPADTTAASTDAETTVDPLLLDELPTDNMEYEGYEYIVLSHLYPESSINWMIQDIYTEEENGERINDAVYARNLAMEERFGVTVKEDLPDNNPHTVAQNRIQAGDDSFAILQTTYENQGTLVVKGFLVNMKNLDYINFDKKWWDTTAIAGTTIADRVYYAAGSGQINNYKATWATLFNKKLTADANIPDLYEIVKSGEWTLDAMKTYGQAIANDVNGDGQMEWGVDVFGVALQNEVVLPLLQGTGEPIVKFQKDGSYEFQLGSEVNVSSMEKIWNFLTSDTGYIINANDYDGMTNQWIEFRKLFMADQMGFFMTPLGTVTLVGGEMESDFGILPIPKASAEQEEYYATIQYNNAHAISIPKTSQDLKRSAMLTEAYQMLAHDTVRTAYYDYTLTLRSSRDNESGEMLDMIFSQRNLDISLAYNGTTGLKTTLQSMGKAASFNFASVVASKGKAFQKTIDKVVDAVIDLEV